MDQMSILFEPNLNFTLDLTEDLKTKYLEQHEKAKRSLENLLKVFCEHQKLLAENIELSITNEKLKRIIDGNGTGQQVLAHIDKVSPSDVNSNCNVSVSSENFNDDQIDQEIMNKCLIEDKENIDQIFTEDFPDLEDDEFKKHTLSVPLAIRTPEKITKHKSSTSIAHTPEKTNSSPVLSNNKRKRNSSKKNSSSLSNTSLQSLVSSNDSKISSPTSKNILAKISEIQDKCTDVLEKDLITNTPFSPVENTFQSKIPCSQMKNQDSRELGISTFACGKSCYEGNKRLRQSKLALKKIVNPINIIDVELDECMTRNNSKLDMDSTWSESFTYKSIIEPSLSNNLTKISEIMHDQEKAPKVENDMINKSNGRTEKNISITDDELIETSPATNENSKLRYKLNLNNKPEITKIKVRPISVINNCSVNLKESPKHESNKNESTSNGKAHRRKHQEDLLNTDNIPEITLDDENETKESPKSVLDKSKSFEPWRSLNDDTYFSPAEETTNKNNIVDVIEFEDEMKCDTPPAKKMLMCSYDKIPGRESISPNFAYKEAAVRNKNEKAQLPGWGCRECEKWYSHLPEEERQKRKNQCSKHRGKYKADRCTPESFWNPMIDDNTLDSSFDDH